MKTKLFILLACLSLVFFVNLFVLAAQYNEAPMLKEQVEAGKLPPVTERLPEEPLVIEPYESVGVYGGSMNLVTQDGAIPHANHMRGTTLLIAMDREFNLTPNVAKSWEVSDDGRQFTLYFRKGMKWSDGEPWTTDDIMFWYNHVLLNKTLTPAIEPFLMDGDKPVKLEQIDKYTIRFSFDTPQGLFLQDLASVMGSASYEMANSPKHYLKQFHPDFADKEALDKKVKEADFDQWDQLFSSKLDTNNPNDVNRPTILPWKIYKPSPNTPIVLIRNPYFYAVDTEGNQLPYIDKLNYHLVSEEELIVMKAISGEIDITPRLQPKHFAILAKEDKAGNIDFFTSHHTNMVSGSLELNYTTTDPVKNKIYNDIRFKKALSYAINRNEIKELVYNGIAGEPRQPLPLKGSMYYVEGMDQLYTEFDPEKSNELLDEMGLNKKDKDGFRLMSNDKRLSMVIITMAAPKELELIKSYFEDIGIQVVMKVTNDWGYYYNFIMSNPDHDAVINWGGAGIFVLSDPRSFVDVTTSTAHFAIPYCQWYNSNGETGQKPTGDFMKAYNLYDKAKVTVDKEKRIEIVHELMELWKKNLWTIGTLGHPPLGYAKNPKLKNVQQEDIYYSSLTRYLPFRASQFYFEK